uniref:Reverse transcriptase domain-containing protein n=1 Tax=Naja naja TaxID=35670 RepID=A0A8C6XN18_NAJNA
MTTLQSILLGIRQGDVLTSIDLTEAYLHIPIRPAHRLCNGSCSHTNEPGETVPCLELQYPTSSSSLFAGGHCPQSTMAAFSEMAQGHWTVPEQSYNINWLELRAVHLALLSFLLRLRSKHILVAQELVLPNFCSISSP